MSENSEESSHYENLLSDSESENKKEEEAEEKEMNSFMVSEFNSEIKKAFLADDSDSEK